MPGEVLFSSEMPQTTQLLIASSNAKMKNQGRVRVHEVSASSSSEDPAESGSSTERGTKGKESVPDLCAVEPSRQSELEDKVEALSAQIAELAALIMKSQEKGQA